MEIKDEWIIRLLAYGIPIIIIHLLFKEYLLGYVLIIFTTSYAENIEKMIDDINSNSVDK